MGRRSRERRWRDRKDRRGLKPKRPSVWELAGKLNFLKGADIIAKQAFQPTEEEREAARAAKTDHVERRATIIDTPFDPAQPQKHKLPFGYKNLGGYITPEGAKALKEFAFDLPDDARLLERFRPYMRPEQMKDLRRAMVAHRHHLEGNDDARETELDAADAANRPHVRKFANYLSGEYLESYLLTTLERMVRSQGVSGAKKHFPGWLDEQLSFFAPAIFVKNTMSSDVVEHELQKRYDLNSGTRPREVCVLASGYYGEKIARKGADAFSERHGLHAPVEAHSPFVASRGICITVYFG